MSSERSRGLASVRLDQDAAISHDRTHMAHTHRMAEDGDMAIAPRVGLETSQQISTILVGKNRNRDYGHDALWPALRSWRAPRRACATVLPAAQVLPGSKNHREYRPDRPLRPSPSDRPPRPSAAFRCYRHAHRTTHCADWHWRGSWFRQAQPCPVSEPASRGPEPAPVQTGSRSAAEIAAETSLSYRDRDDRSRR